jgi:hypothetical protein
MAAILKFLKSICIQKCIPFLSSPFVSQLAQNQQNVLHRNYQTTKLSSETQTKNHVTNPIDAAEILHNLKQKSTFLLFLQLVEFSFTGLRKF